MANELAQDFHRTFYPMFAHRKGLEFLDVEVVESDAERTSNALSVDFNASTRSFE
jgi:hypothetical protein